jgi:hypothetical protein
MTTITSVESIKSLDEEYAKLCKENTQLRKNLMEDPEMEDVNERLRNALEKEHKAMGNIRMFLASERVATILVNMLSYNEIEQLREEQKTLTQRFIPL